MILELEWLSRRNNLFQISKTTIKLSTYASAESNSWDEHMLVAETAVPPFMIENSFQVIEHNTRRRRRRRWLFKGVYKMYTGCM